MSAKWPKLLHDSVHQLITFDESDCDKLLLNLINTSEFQRLRRIKQLGFSETVFPGANHSRFAHCIGVLQMARLFLNRLKVVSKGIDDDVSKIVLCAALLHDLGHGPFSHAFEKVTKDKHEDRTREIVETEDTDVHKRLAEHDPALPALIASFWKGTAVLSVPGFLAQVVSSQLDADRFDYLLRDSYAAGVNYGDFDHLWLIAHLHADEKRSRLFLGAKALLAAEAYVFARYHMYRTVYFHKTTRAAEVMLRLLFERYHKLVSGKSLPEANLVVPDAPKEVVTAFSSKLTLQGYLNLDDHSISQFCKACERSGDNTLRWLGAGLLHRHLLKAIDATDRSPEATMQFALEASELLKKGGYDADFMFYTDSPKDTPYKLYNPDEEAQDTQIYVEDGDGKQTEISKLSTPVAQLRKYAFSRFYFPEDLRADIEKIADKTLRS
jgi:HD superfamily phosphohydrolase